jgi:(2Fe-2S) ferredoxin
MMKVLVCNKAHCNFSENIQIIEKLEQYKDVHVVECGCFGKCEEGPNLMTLCDEQYFGHVTPERVDDILFGSAEDLRYKEEELYNQEMDVYKSDPHHRRTVKLFRYHMEKLQQYDKEHVADEIEVMKEKYDISKKDCKYAVKVALMNTRHCPDVPTLVEQLGIEEVFKRIDRYLADNKYRI